jgi:HlyD family secretion protein
MAVAHYRGVEDEHSIRDTSSMDRPVDRRPVTRRRWVVGGCVAALLVLLLILAWPTARRWTVSERSVDRSRLRIATVTRGELVFDVAVDGRVVAANRPTLFSPADGTVTLHVREGQGIGAGQVLAELVSPELESRLEQERASLDVLRSELERRELEAEQGVQRNRQALELAQVRLAAAERAVERYERLFELGLVNEIDLEHARDERTVAAVEVEQARDAVGLEREMLALHVRDSRSRLQRQQLVTAEVARRVNELKVVAPFDGQVATVEVEDRDVVVQGQPLVGVVDLSELELEVSIPETYADRVAPGVEAVVRIGGDEVDGAVTEVAPEVLSGQVAGRVAFVDGAPVGLRQNQRLSTRLVLARRSDVLMLPRGPFVESVGGEVYVVADELAVRRPVSFGVVSVTKVEILDGLSKGEQVVISDMTRFEGADTLLVR